MNAACESLSAPVLDRCDALLKVPLSELGTNAAEEATGSTPALASSSAAASGMLWTESQELYEDPAIEARVKLAMLAPRVRQFLEQETHNLLHAKKPLDVSSHTTFGRLKAQVLGSCTCSDESKESKLTCQLHAPSPSLMDIVHPIACELYSKFDDEFVCFANLFLERQAQGGVVVLWLGPFLLLAVVVVLVVSVLVILLELVLLLLLTLLLPLLLLLLLLLLFLFLLLLLLLLLPLFLLLLVVLMRLQLLQRRCS